MASYENVDSILHSNNNAVSNVTQSKITLQYNHKYFIHLISINLDHKNVLKTQATGFPLESTWTNS